MGRRSVVQSPWLLAPFKDDDHLPKGLRIVPLLTQFTLDFT